MPYVEVYVDTDDCLRDVSEEELRKELDSRMRKDGRGGWGTHFGIPAGEARAALDEAATYFRKIGKHALAFKMDEIAEDYVGAPERHQVKAQTPIATLPALTRATK